MPSQNSEEKKSSDLIHYFLIAYAFTWTFHLAIPLLGLSFSLNPAKTSMQLYLIGLLGPLFAAAIVTSRTEGREGLRRLFQTGLRWRFNPFWYFFAALIVALLMFANIGISTKAIPILQEHLSFPLFIIFGQIWVVIGEEFGWRGFALPRLQKRLGSLGASLLIGVLWAGWHLPMFFVPHSPQYAESFVSAFPVYILQVTYWSIIITMLYNRSNGSVLLCMIFHAAFNIAIYSIHIPKGSNIMMLLYLPVVAVSILLLPRPFFGKR